MNKDGWGFQIYNENELIADVFINTRTMKVDLKQYSKYNHLRMFLNDEITVDEVLGWLQDRCFPKTRANCKELLGMLGLRTYDVIDITKITHGLMMDDYIWIKWLG